VTTFAAQRLPTTFVRDLRRPVAVVLTPVITFILIRPLIVVIVVKIVVSLTTSSIAIVIELHVFAVGSDDVDVLLESVLDSSLFAFPTTTAF
jgi:hypothetical protein